MKLKKMWEYNIGAEFRAPNSQMEFKVFYILSEDSPETGWAKVFEALKGEFGNMQKIQNASCYPKDLLIL